MNLRVSRQRISVPLSEMANNSGTARSSSLMAASSRVARRSARSSRSSPSASSALVNRTRTSTPVASDAKMVAIHLRETRSMMAYVYLAVTQRSNCDMSQHHS